MPARLFLSSGDLVADRRFEFARDLQLKGDLVAAADLLLQATELAPGFISAWFSLGAIRQQLGRSRRFGKRWPLIPRTGMARACG
jgi:hypothetical protein